VPAPLEAIVIHALLSIKALRPFIVASDGVKLPSMAEKQNQEVKHLIKIEHKIDEIKNRTGSFLRAFVGGVLYGVGWILGGIIAIVALSWILSLMGVIPGLADIAQYLYNILQTWHGR